jgi:transcriptional regulator with XRE-family HTH domain
MDSTPEPETFAAGKPPETVREYFAVELKQFRRVAGVTQDQLAEQIQYSAQLVSAVENCTRTPRLDFAQRCDRALGTGGSLSRMWYMLAKEVHPKWFRSFVALEAEATALREYEVRAVPGLLQTEAYARANLSASWPPKAPEELERVLSARLERQHIMDRDNPPMLWFVLDESVLYREVGGPAVMAEQLHRLVEMASRPFIGLVVLPMAHAGRAPMDGQFILLDLPRGERYAYVEGPASGQVIVDPGDVEKCARAFEMLLAQALPVEDSVALILRTIGERYAHPSGTSLVEE